MGFLATSRRARRAFACAPLLCTLAALPAAALARDARSGGTGGGGIGVSGGAGTTSSPAAPVAAAVVRLGGVVNATGDGITLTVAASGTQGHPLTITGAAPGSDAGALIEVESAQPGHTNWTPIASAVIASGGGFTAHWTPRASAQVALRAVLAPNLGSTGTGSGAGGLPTGSSASAAASEVATSPLTIPIFRDARATMYGPGFWGHHTACGERLTRATLGVASRTLKCGTRVAIYFDGNEITVPVIDRGPFSNHASWDLTMATATALGMTQTSVIGTLSPAPAPAPPAGA